jgi:hypothetical protein
VPSIDNPDTRATAENPLTAGQHQVVGFAVIGLAANDTVGVTNVSATAD